MVGTQRKKGNGKGIKADRMQEGRTNDRRMGGTDGQTDGRWRDAERDAGRDGWRSRGRDVGTDGQPRKGGVELDLHLN